MGRVKCWVCDVEIPPYEITAFEERYVCETHAAMIRGYIVELKEKVSKGLPIYY